MDTIIKDAIALRQISTPVETPEEAIDIINRLTEVLSKHKNGIGLSAIQIGIPKQVSVIVRENDSPIHIINPTAIDLEEPFTFIGEGCLSFPEKYINTLRYRHVTVNHKVIRDGKFEDQIIYLYCSDDGDTVYDGIYAVAVQHELDHCAGVLFLDRENKILGKTIENLDKVGRNEPCPCGNSKDGKPVKYKKCCGK